MLSDTAIKAADVMRQLERDFGMSPDVLQRIGAFILQWSVFDAALEQVICVLDPGLAAKTDALQFAGRITLFEDEMHKLDAEWPLLGTTVAIVARAVLDYRNTIAHGLPNERQQLVKNYFPIGYNRKKEPGNALVPENVLNGAIASADILMSFTGDFLQSAQEQGVKAHEVKFDRLGHLSALQGTLIYKAHWMEMRGIR